MTSSMYLEKNDNDGSFKPLGNSSEGLPKKCV